MEDFTGFAVAHIYEIADNSIMKTKCIGQVVVVKDFMGRAFLRKVFQISENAIFITSENGYKNLLKGEKTPWPIGVRPEDVYKFEGNLPSQYPQWDKMKRWSPVPRISESKSRNAAPSYDPVG